jgi:hypothetical protein
MTMAKVLNGMVSTPLGITEWGIVTWRVIFSLLEKINTALVMGLYLHTFDSKNYCVIFKSILKTK